MVPDELQELITPEDQYDTRPVIEFLIRLAKIRGASDLHLSPLPDRVEVGLRVDGVLRHEFDFSHSVHKRLMVGLKNGAKLVSYKRSTPQDGSFQAEGLDVRVATVPTVYGERVVARLLYPATEAKGLENLGFSDAQLKALEKMIDIPQGLFLVTGPAGSGKTTSLIALMVRLVELRRRRLSNDKSYRCSVVTLEDPVEYLVPEFHQTSINPKVGMTFGEGIRSLLRQDPEVILVGEIRDRETAEAVVQAGLSGHVVFSSLHANDAVGVIPRLLELGVQGYQLSAALTGIVSQRLVRTLCAQCKRQEGSEWLPVGCPSCLESGYSGRTAVAEILTVDEIMQEMILSRASLQDMRRYLSEKETTFLWDRAQQLCREGVTSQAEAKRVV